MKNVVFIFVCILVLSACSQGNGSDSVSKDAVQESAVEDVAVGEDVADRGGDNRPPRGERPPRRGSVEQVGITDPTSLGAPQGVYNFVEKALASDLLEGDCTLSNGDTAKCLNVVINNIPETREPGPFCPTTITTSAAESGIWLDGENLYEADGAFVASLAEVYGDENWKLYNDDGSVRITDTQEAFDAAARPDVDPAYQNHCVQGSADWIDADTNEYVIPSEPVYVGIAQTIREKVGVTFDGVVIDPAAPVDAILGAYTIAVFDDCGGHFNPVDGYHMHGAVGCGEVGEVAVNETKPFALAVDGFPIHSPYEAGAEPTDLDDCGGHETDELGYHYHAQSPEKNGVLTCLMGATVQ